MEIEVLFLYFHFVESDKWNKLNAIVINNMRDENLVVQYTFNIICNELIQTKVPNLNCFALYSLL